MTSLIQQLALQGKLTLLHDYRAGHCASLVPTGQLIYTPRDGRVHGDQGRFRTGRGFDSVWKQTNAPSSVGYIVTDAHIGLIPGGLGCCILASYIPYHLGMAAGYAKASQVVGSMNSVAAASSWALKRDSGNIYFVTCDGITFSDHAYALAATPGVIETVGIIYDGGISGNNSHIYVYTPTPSQDLGAITQIPYNVGPIAASMGALTDVAENPFQGILRWCAFLKSPVNAATLALLKDEIEAMAWPTELCHASESHIIPERQLQYETGFGIDKSVTDETSLVDREVSNSRFFTSAESSSTFRVNTDRLSLDFVSTENIHKVLECVDVDGELNTHLYNPVTQWKATPAQAAWGTWDFHYKFQEYAVGDLLPRIWLVSDDKGDTGKGYYVTVSLTGGVFLKRHPGGDPVISGAPGDIPYPGWVHIRVTRNQTTGDWRLFINTNLTLDGWVEIGTPAADNLWTESQYVTILMSPGDMFCLGNSAGEHGFFKWEGVVDPLPANPD